MKEHSVGKTISQILILGVLAFVTYYLIMRDKDFGDVWQVVVNTNKLWIIACVAVMTIYVFCGGWCIRVLMKARQRVVSIPRCFKYSLIEFYFSALTPSSTGGQPMQLFYMNRDGFPISDSSVVLMAVTVLYKFAFLVITAILFLINIGFIGERIVHVLPLAIIGLVLNLLLIAFLLLVLYSKSLVNKLIRWAVRVGGKFHFIKDVDSALVKAEEKLAQYHECAGFFAEHRGLVLKTFGVLALQRIALLSIPFLIYKSFGLNEYNYFQVTAIQCLLNLCADMMPIPGAVGITESVFLMLFAPIFTEGKIATAVLLSRGFSFYLLLIAAGLYICIYQLIGIVRTGKNIKAEEKVAAIVNDTKDVYSEEE